MNYKKRMCLLLTAVSLSLAAGSAMAVVSPQLLAAITNASNNVGAATSANMKAAKNELVAVVRQALALAQSDDDAKTIISAAVKGAPGAAVDIVTAAVQLAPQKALVIAAVAVSMVPDQRDAIITRVAAITGIPKQEITAQLSQDNATLRHSDIHRSVQNRSNHPEDDGGYGAGGTPERQVQQYASPS